MITTVQTKQNKDKAMTCESHCSSLASGLLSDNCLSTACEPRPAAHTGTKNAKSQGS